MSNKDALLPTAPDCVDYGAVKDQTVIGVEYGQAEHDDVCVSFHDVSYVVSSCFGKGQGSTVIEAGVVVLVCGQKCVVFPEAPRLHAVKVGRLYG